MSNIPNSAMPHAGPTADAETQQGGETLTLAQRVREQADRVSTLARENPKAAIAAGAAVAAGVAGVAAAAVVKSRRGKTAGGTAAGGARKTPARGKKA